MRAGSSAIFLPEPMGLTGVLHNSSGVKEEDVVYYPYAETFTKTGTANGAYKYTGKELDNNTGLDFYEARYYSRLTFKIAFPLTPALSPKGRGRSECLN